MIRLKSPFVIPLEVFNYEGIMQVGVDKLRAQLYLPYFKTLVMYQQIFVVEMVNVRK